MRNKNWRQVETIFHTALGLGGDERVSYLSEKCSGDAALLSEVESLIFAFENESDFLEEPAFSLGLNVLGHGTEKDLTGEKIGFYEIREKLGGGGMGDVYLADDTRLNRKVALKFLKGNFGDDKWAKRQFMKEAQAVAMLEHPNICAVHSIEEIDEHNFIVMQFVEGDTLGKFISGRELSLEKILSIAHQMIGAVALAHSHGIIHRDIKPGNIMITSEGLVKVLDFGLAKVVEQKHKTGRAEEHSQISQNGLILGTVSYMSPEQLRAERLDFRSDIFGVGIVLYEMLAKESPFSRKSQAETIAAILSDQPASLKDIEMPIPEALGFIVQKCLNKDKEKRFQSAAEILVELDKVESAAIPRRIKGFFVKFVLAAATAVLLVVLFAMFFYTGKASPKTLAVLPITFENAPADKEYLADGLTKIFIDKLSRLPDLKVKNESLTSRYKDGATEPQTAGKELNADVVLVGKIQKRGEELVLVATLLRTSDGSVIDTYEKGISETGLSSLEEDISTRVLSKLNSSVSTEDKSRLAKKDTESEEAKAAYLRGRFYLKRKTQSDDPQRAKNAFTEAKDLDQNFAKAWAGLADAYLALASPGTVGAMSPEQAVTSAKKAANKALELDNALCDSYNSLGLIALRYEWNWSEAETYFRTALAYDPEFLPARNGLVLVLTTLQRFDEAMLEAEKIKKYDPLSVTSDLQQALISYRKYDFEQSDRILTELLQRFPNDRNIRNVRVYQLMKTQRFNEALDILEPAYASEDKNEKVFAAAPLGYAYGKMNRRTEALKIIEDLKKLEKNGYIPAQERAIIYIGTGDFDRALEQLKLSCAERFASLPGLVVDPLVDEMKSDPRFVEIRRCVNL
jgi:TolB-like protein/thioredoxin-like negative regulator of GroEL